jgi:hypothetical protein
MRVGNVAHDEVGEHHWHGAEADTTMSHITITLRLILGRARYLTVRAHSGPNVSPLPRAMMCASVDRLALGAA